MSEPSGERQDEYDPAALVAVLSTLERVLRCFGAARDHVTIIGGLAPALLVPAPIAGAHVGTTDIDLCLTMALAEGETGYYEEVAPALQRAGFEQVSNPRQRFRWGREGILVDFLYPAADGDRPLAAMRRGEDWETTAQRSLGENFAALAVGYPALLDATRLLATFETRLDGGAVPCATVHVSGAAALAGLKADALGASGRHKPKDAYDIVWTLDNLGPEDAARDTLERIARNELALRDLHTATDALSEVFAEGRVGPAWYANFVESGDPGQMSAEGRARHEQFAHATVRAFTDTLRTGAQGEGS